MSDNTNDVQNEAVAAPPKRIMGLTVGQVAQLAAVLVMIAIVGVQLMQQSRTQPTEGIAPDFEFTTFIDEETMRLSDLRGNVVVINFWASWCIPCKDEAPELEAAWQQYKDDNVVFLGIAYADNGPRSLEFMERYGITYMNAPDIETRISELYNIQGVPETFIIDQNGNVAQFIYAGVNRQSLASYIDPLLAAEG